MRKPQILTIGLSLFVGYLLAMTLNRTSSGQPSAPPPATQEAAVWRYQLTSPIDGGYKGYVILTDTATGHCWMRYNAGGSGWENLGSPVNLKRK